MLKRIILIICQLLLLIFAVVPLCALPVAAQTRVLSGVIVTQQQEVVPGVTVLVHTDGGDVQTTSDGDGRFRVVVPAGVLAVKFFGQNIALVSRTIQPGAASEDLSVQVEYLVAQIHESVVIVSDSLDPAVERRNDTIYKGTLFSRDDQLLQTLAAGIDAGQHEGGGKSLEVRRFGFNLDHGGVNGGLKILVDDVQQNQGTQGHGQGYLGQLKSLTPELVQDVDIINGPFNAQYGDFSGLGVVHIRLKESLPDQLTVRLQGGSFNTERVFVAYSPHLKHVNSFIAYEGTHTDGPFQNRLRYRRDNVTGNYTRTLAAKQSVGFKFNFGRNDFFSSGQIPLDEVAAGRVDRFGFVDPADGGRVRTGITSAYYRKEWAGGRVLKVDGFGHAQCRASATEVQRIVSAVAPLPGRVLLQLRARHLKSGRARRRRPPRRAAPRDDRLLSSRHGASTQTLRAQRRPVSH